MMNKPASLVLGLFLGLTFSACEKQGSKPPGDDCSEGARDLEGTTRCGGLTDGCPEDAKVCPDGTTLVRTGPSCEFAACPGEAVMCTTEARMCADGSEQPRNMTTCEWLPCPGELNCSTEAKVCPDGTGVGRTGPNCEFAPCPGE